MDLDALWDRAISLSTEPEGAMLRLAWAGHPNATAVVRSILADCDCESCGSLEECPGATPEAFAKRAALRDLASALLIPWDSA